MSDKTPKVLVAVKGFSANGVTMHEGERHVDQFDKQVLAQLVGMGRLVEVDDSDEDGDEPKKRGGKKAELSLPGV